MKKQAIILGILTLAALPAYAAINSSACASVTANTGEFPTNGKLGYYSSPLIYCVFEQTIENKVTDWVE